MTVLVPLLSRSSPDGMPSSVTYPYAGLLGAHKFGCTQTACAGVGRWPLHAYHSCPQMRVVDLWGIVAWHLHADRPGSSCRWWSCGAGSACNSSWCSSIQLHMLAAHRRWLGAEAIWGSVGRRGCSGGCIWREGGSAGGCGRAPEYESSCSMRCIVCILLDHL